MMSFRKILFFDEPTSRLEHRNMQIVAKNLIKAKRQDKLKLVISHGLEFLEAVCDTIIKVNPEMNNRAI